MLLLKMGFVYSQQAENNIETLVRNFMDTMVKQQKLNSYVDNIDNRIVNYFMVKNYKITKIDGDKAIVEIDHGKGIYCTRIYLTMINSYGSYKIKSYPNKNPQLVNPWERKEKICN